MEGRNAPTLLNVSAEWSFLVGLSNMPSESLTYLLGCSHVELGSHVLDHRNRRGCFGFVRNRRRGNANRLDSLCSRSDRRRHLFSNWTTRPFVVVAGQDDGPRARARVCPIRGAVAPDRSRRLLLDPTHKSPPMPHAVGHIQNTNAERSIHGHLAGDASCLHPCVYHCIAASASS